MDKKNHKYLRIENGRYIYPDDMPSSARGQHRQVQMDQRRVNSSNYMPASDQARKGQIEYREASKRSNASNSIPQSVYDKMSNEYNSRENRLHRKVQSRLDASNRKYDEEQRLSSKRSNASQDIPESVQKKMHDAAVSQEGMARRRVLNHETDVRRKEEEKRKREKQAVNYENKRNNKNNTSQNIPIDVQEKMRDAATTKEALATKKIQQINRNKLARAKKKVEDLLHLQSYMYKGDRDARTRAEERKKRQNAPRHKSARDIISKNQNARKRYYGGGDFYED